MRVAHRGDAPDSIGLSVFVEVPAVQAISREDVAALLHDAVDHVASSVGCLLSLPAAKQLSAGQLLQLGSSAAVRNASTAARELIG